MQSIVSHVNKEHERNQNPNLYRVLYKIHVLETQDVNSIQQHRECICPTWHKFVNQTEAQLFVLVVRGVAT
eukprot:1141717-Pelagomonas_calceolata.AAC.2